MASSVARALIPSIELSDGARAEKTATGGLELRDACGRLLVRYQDGEAEVFASDGDLTLAAPNGKVVLDAVDLELRAERDIIQRVGRKVSATVGAQAEPQFQIDATTVRVNSNRVEVDAQQTQLQIGRASLVAEHISTTAKSIAQSAERYELVAGRLIEKTRDTFRETSGLVQQRVGRLRTLVEDVYAVYSRRTTLSSKDDTSIDGKRILLG